MTQPEIRSLAAGNEIAVACAYNFPAILQIFGKKRWPQLFQVFKDLLALKNRVKNKTYILNIIITIIILLLI